MTDIPIPTQIGGTKTSISAVMVRPSFIIGYESVKRKAKFDYSRVAPNGDEWQYERGRQFAIYLKTINQKRFPLTKNGFANWRLVSLLAQAFRDGAIT